MDPHEVTKKDSYCLKWKCYHLFTKDLSQKWSDGDVGVHWFIILSDGHAKFWRYVDVKMFVTSIYRNHCKQIKCLADFYLLNGAPIIRSVHEVMNFWIHLQIFCWPNFTDPPQSIGHLSPAVSPRFACIRLLTDAQLCPTFEWRVHNGRTLSQHTYRYVSHKE